MTRNPRDARVIVLTNVHIYMPDIMIIPELNISHACVAEAVWIYVQQF